MDLRWTCVNVSFRFTCLYSSLEGSCKYVWSATTNSFEHWGVFSRQAHQDQCHCFSVHTSKYTPSNIIYYTQTQPTRGKEIKISQMCDNTANLWVWLLCSGSSLPPGEGKKNVRQLSVSSVEQEAKVWGLASGEWWVKRDQRAKMTTSFMDTVVFFSVHFSPVIQTFLSMVLRKGRRKEKKPHIQI